ncbi:MAG TPA: ATP-binding protein [Ktedonobacteraceae bacterium]|nr:ATP-binding protein [Ktedonobacteraceae bacterium]
MSNSTPFHVIFRPQARLLSLLGDQMISDQAVGLIELVKNAYDATRIEIELLGLASPETTRVVIRDNGFGMTREDVMQKWLSPAINHKERQKKARQRTPLGRLPIGEKGVGRFAAQKLGHKFQMVSRAAHSSEVVVQILTSLPTRISVTVTSWTALIMFSPDWFRRKGCSITNIPVIIQPLLNEKLL